MGSNVTLGIAFVGTGYVSDLYFNTLPNWPNALDLRGVFDRDTARSAAFQKTYGAKVYPSLDDLLADPSVEIVVNLTNPFAHYEISKAALSAGKHVYSEKPLSLDLGEAEELLALANERGLHIASAPATVLGQSAQTMIRAVRDRTFGAPRLVYAELDDGMVHRIGYQRWRVPSGAFWPAEDEFRTGCTLEHAGYVLTWLVAMFGGARKVVTYADKLIKDKGPHTPGDGIAPDFSCACLSFDGGITARITNSIIATHDHRLRVFCDNGHFEAHEAWNVSGKVRAVPVHTKRAQRGLHKIFGYDGGHTLAPQNKRKVVSLSRGYPMDFALGVAEMALAIEAGRTPRLSSEFGLHITEVSLAIQHPERFGHVYEPKSAPPPMEPMDPL